MSKVPIFTTKIQQMWLLNRQQWTFSQREALLRVHSLDTHSYQCWRFCYISHTVFQKQSLSEGGSYIKAISHLGHKIVKILGHKYTYYWKMQLLCKWLSRYGTLYRIAAYVDHISLLCPGDLEIHLSWLHRSSWGPTQLTLKLGELLQSYSTFHLSALCLIFNFFPRPPCPFKVKVQHFFYLWDIRSNSINNKNVLYLHSYQHKPCIF